MAELALSGETRIRRARPSDLPGLVALAMEALTTNPTPGLRVSRTKVEEMGRYVISSPKDFVWVAERDGEIVGSVAAVVSPITFHERSQANVVQFYCKVPGYGIKLIRELMAWAKGRPAIKAVLFTLEHDADPRIGKLLNRLGLEAILPVYMGVL